MVEETFAAADVLVAAHTQIAEMLDIGDCRARPNAACRYDPKVLRLTNRDLAGPKPALVLQTRAPQLCGRHDLRVD